MKFMLTSLPLNIIKIMKTIEKYYENLMGTYGSDKNREFSTGF